MVWIAGLQGKHKIGWTAKFEGLWLVVQSPTSRQVLQGSLGGNAVSISNETARQKAPYASMQMTPSWESSQ